MKHVYSKAHVFIALALVAAIGITLERAASAHEGATGIVMERMMLMKDIAADLKKAAAMIRSADALDRQELSDIGARLSRHGGMIDAQFPDTSESRNSPVSEATPEIWTNRAAFRQQAEALSTAASQLSDASKGGTTAAIEQAFKAVAASCGACHKQFRKKK